MALDLLRLAWLLGVTCLLVWASGAGRRGVGRDPAARIALVARAVVLVVLAVNVLTRLHIFNAATLLAACLAWPVARWLKRYDWAPDHALRSFIRAGVLATVRRAEQPLPSSRLVGWTQRARHLARAHGRVVRRRLGSFTAAETALAGAAGAALAAAVYVRFAPVIGEPRLGDPRLYSTLLHARQALFNAPDGVVSVLSAVSAALSTAASMHTLHVVRLIGPVAGLATIATAAALVRRTTGSNGAGVITLAILAALTSPYGGELDVAILFALLGAMAWSYRTPASRHGLFACVAVALLAATRLDAAALPERLLPVAAAIAGGTAFAGLAALARRSKSLRIDLAATPVACAALVVLLPQTSGPLYLEYPAAQAQTLEMTSTLPRGKWLLVAPVEQLAEAYGRGWYEDSSAFVERYAARAGDPALTFDYSVDEIFVMVEKRPFKTFHTEAAAVPFSTLTDPTYRHYRSLAGRSSLQARLRGLCEAYRRSHEGASIHYEDDDLTIYRFRLRG